MKTKIDSLLHDSFKSVIDLQRMRLTREIMFMNSDNEFRATKVNAYSTHINYIHDISHYNMFTLKNNKQIIQQYTPEERLRANGPSERSTIKYCSGLYYLYQKGLAHYGEINCVEETEFNLNVMGIEPGRVQLLTSLHEAVNSEKFEELKNCMIDCSANYVTNLMENNTNYFIW